MELFCFGGKYFVFRFVTAVVVVFVAAAAAATAVIVVASDCFAIFVKLLFICLLCL